MDLFQVSLAVTGAWKGTSLQVHTAAIDALWFHCILLPFVKDVQSLMGSNAHKCFAVRSSRSWESHSKGEGHPSTSLAISPRDISSSAELPWWFLYSTCSPGYMFVSSLHSVHKEGATGSDATISLQFKMCRGAGGGRETSYQSESGWTGGSCLTLKEPPPPQTQSVITERIWAGIQKSMGWRQSRKEDGS